MKEDFIEKLLINFIDNNKMYEEKNIIYGDRGQSFKNMIKNILTLSQLKPKYIDILLDEYSLSIYDITFTHKSANSLQNYEIYEILGDTTVNKCIVWYLTRRFPYIWNDPSGVEKLSKSTSKLRSKKTLSTISKTIDFWKFISADQDARNLKKTDILEDVFEAFIGATEFLLDERIKRGVGYTICYTIMKTIFDSQEISLDLSIITDPITRLKETFDSKELKEKGIGIQEISAVMTPENKWYITIYKTDNRGNRILLGEGLDFKKRTAQYTASEKALKRLKDLGFVKS